MRTTNTGSIMTIPAAGLFSDLDPVRRGRIERQGRTQRTVSRSLALMSVASLALGFALSLAPAAPARAALGGTVDSVTTDSRMMRGVLRSTGFVQYDVQEIQSGSVTIREYVTRQGQVFAVSWQGPEQPDLQQLLGEYFPRFQTAAVAAHAVSPGIHRQLSIAQSDLVLSSSGRMRDFHGLAYLPALVPDGVSVSSLQ